MTTDISTPLGAHASVLMKLREKSLQAYGISLQDLTVTNGNQALVELPKTKMRSLAKIAKNSRALAVETDHAMVVL